MSPKLPRVNTGRVERAIKRGGWFRVRQSGSHAIYHHPTKAGRVTLSIHPSDEVLPKTLAGIIKDAGLTVEELIKLL